MRAIMAMHLCKRGFMFVYTIWTKYGEEPNSESTLEIANDIVDGLDEMLAHHGDAMYLDSIEDEPMAHAKEFYTMLEVVDNS